MLPRIDSTLAWLSWIAAAALVLMLFIGPQVIAEDEEQSNQAKAAGAAPYGGDASTAGNEGETVFVDSCGSCHTLGAAGTSGTVGPTLDGTSLDAAEIESIVRDGSGGMPSFGGQLSEAEIAAVAEFVAGAD